jgi:hypothetical protein
MHARSHLDRRPDADALIWDSPEFEVFTSFDFVAQVPEPLNNQGGQRDAQAVCSRAIPK